MKQLLVVVGFGVVASCTGFIKAPPRLASHRQGHTWRRQGNVVCNAIGAGSKQWALIFDCDGVILESESLHRDAYNAMFEEFDVDYNWSPEYYDELQNRIGGGIPKMRYYFEQFGWPHSTLGPPPSKSEDKERLLNTFQDRKTQIYKDLISSGTAQVRPGVMRVIEEVRNMGNARLAICSASTKTSCLFVLENLLGPALHHFDLILAGDDVKHRKPDPEIYRLASTKLDMPPERCVVIEDSLIGLQAALGAGMPCIITYTPSTQAQEFKGAKVVVSELGDGPGAVSARQLQALVAV